MRFFSALALFCFLFVGEARRLNYKTWFSFPKYFEMRQREDREIARRKNPQLFKTALQENWYVQPIDHFDPVNNGTWKQLYYVNEKYYKKPATGKKATAFFYFNGEAALSPVAIDGTSFIMELAERYNAFVVTHEHRYYGRSFPVPDLSVNNMRYLSTEQALEDAAQFQTWINDLYGLGEIGKDVNWVIIGGSYSGFLSTAYRIRYPHLVTAAWSSSGVVWPKDNFPEFFETVVNDYSWEKGCSEVFDNITSIVTDLWKTTAGRQTIKTMFDICDDMTDADEADMWSLVSSPYASMAQYGSSSALCKIVMATNDPLKTYSLLFRQIGASMGKMAAGDCNEIHWANADYNLTLPYDGFRTWMWQTCTEFGWYQTFDTVNVWSKSINLNYYHKNCDAMFGESAFRPNTKRVLYNYGGMKPEGSQIVSVSGLADPWHPVCQQETYKDTEPVYFINAHDASHCKEMGTPASDDSAELKEARVFVRKYLDEWLGY